MPYLLIEENIHEDITDLAREVSHRTGLGYCVGATVLDKFVTITSHIVIYVNEQCTTLMGGSGLQAERGECCSLRGRRNTVKDRVLN